MNTLKLSAFAVLAIFLQFASHPPAAAQDKVRNITYDNVIIVDEAGRLNPDGLLKLGCEPLAALRHRFLMDNGYCFRRTTYYTFYFNKICAPGVREQDIYDRMDNEIWKTIEVIKTVEGQKGCRRIEE
jgi:hypothetical protein